MRMIFRLILPLLLLTSSVFAADPREASLRALTGRLAGDDQIFLANAKYAGHYSLDRLVGFASVDGRLVATFHLPAELVRQFADPAPLLISLEGSPHVWSLHRRKAGTLDAGLSMITLTCYAPDETWPFNRFSLASDGQSVMVAGTQMFGRPAEQQSITLNQGERTLRIATRLELERWTPKTFDLIALNQVPVRAPNLLEKYLLPVLNRLGPARPASDVYRVFDQIPADPQVARQILPLIAKLDADDPKHRDEAVAALRALGRPAVLTCLRLDASTLSPEQANRLSAVYASEGWLHVADIEAARRDPAFLTSCLEDEDPAVRTAAATLLAAQRAARMLR
jgi:hypothetical protein